MRKTLQNISKLRLAAIVAVVVAVAVAAFWLSRTVSRSSVSLGSDKKIDITPEQIRSIKAIGQWEFLSITNEEMVDTVRRGFFSDDRLVRTINPVDNQLVAAKLVFTLPLGGGELSWGGEYTHTARTDNYLSETEGYVPTSYSEIKEDNTAVFAEYGRSLPFGSFTAGLRYEHVAFDYWKNHTYMGEQSRAYDNLFPTVGLNAKAGPVQASLSYATKVDRPRYDALSNNLAYYSRYLVVQGDPTLRPSVTHDLTLASTWRFLQLMVSYQHQKDVILEWLSPWTEEPGALYARKINSGKVPQVSAFLSASPKIGLWSPSWTVGVVRNWFSIDGDFLSYKSDRPIWSASLNNSLRLFWGLTLDANFVFQSKGKIYHVRYDRPVYALNVALRKSFLNDALSVELRGNGCCLSAAYMQDGQAVLRLFNASGKEETCDIRLHMPLREAEAVELDGRRIGTLPLRKAGKGASAVRVSLPKFGIRTLRLRLATE